MLSIYAFPGHLIRRAHQLSTAVFADRVAAAGEDLTPVQYGALAGIQARPGLDQGTLAGLIAYDRVTIAGVLDRLQAKGLIERGTSPLDRRAKVLLLTAKGADLLERLTPVVAGLQSDILPNLNAREQKDLLRLLTKAVGPGQPMPGLTEPVQGSEEGTAETVIRPATRKRSTGKQPTAGRETGR